jgi:hypothetical protein
MAPIYAGVEDGMGNILLNFFFCILSKRETRLYNVRLHLLRCETCVMYVHFVFNCKGRRPGSSASFIDVGNIMLNFFVFFT